MSKVNNLAIIPARGGSKGIKKKNLIKVNNMPLIGFTINAIKKSKKFDKIIVSSDSIEILNAAILFGAETIKRPKNIARDDSSSEDAVIHVLNNLSKKHEIENIGLFQATSPLRTEVHIKQSFNQFIKEASETLISVKRIDNKFLKAFYQEGIHFHPIKKDFPFSPRQKLPLAFLPNGAIYLAKFKSFIKTKSFYSKKMSFYTMSDESSLDIDTMSDFNTLQGILKRKANS